MALLLLTNVPDGTPDDELLAFLAKYGIPQPDEVEHIEGDGSRPSVMLTFHAVDADALEPLRTRIHDMYWKNHRLSVMVLHERFT